MILWNSGRFSIERGGSTLRQTNDRLPRVPLVPNPDQLNSAKTASHNPQNQFEKIPIPPPDIDNLLLIAQHRQDAFRESPPAVYMQRRSDRCFVESLQDASERISEAN